MAFSGCYFEKGKFVNNSNLDAETNNYWGATIVDSKENGFYTKDRVLIKYTGNETSVTIPNSVTSIGVGAFSGCSGLTSVTIPNSVTSIEFFAFAGCSGLTSISVESGNEKYDSRDNCNAIIKTASNTLIAGCKNTTIPNSVTSIGRYAFIGCSGLTSVTIPNSVTSIGNLAFDGADIPTVISLIENPFTIEGKTSDYRTFTQNTFNNATLYVPKGTIEKYKATDGWKDFVFMEEGEGPGGDTPEPPIPETQKCATPTISYENGKLTFDCETEGVEYVSSITPPSAFNSGSKTVSMPTTYKVTVYAKKDGLENSDVATKEIDLGTSGIRGDLNGDGVVNMPDAMFIVNKMLKGKFPDEELEKAGLRFGFYGTIPGYFTINKIDIKGLRHDKFGTDMVGSSLGTSADMPTYDRADGSYTNVYFEDSNNNSSMNIVIEYSLDGKNYSYTYQTDLRDFKPNKNYTFIIGFTLHEIFVSYKVEDQDGPTQ